MKPKSTIDITGFAPSEAIELINDVLIQYLTTTDDPAEKRQDIAVLFNYISEAVRGNPGTNGTIVPMDKT